MGTCTRGLGVEGADVGFGVLGLGLLGTWGEESLASIGSPLSTRAISSSIPSDTSDSDWCSLRRASALASSLLLQASLQGCALIRWMSDRNLHSRELSWRQLSTVSNAVLV